MKRIFLCVVISSVSFLLPGCQKTTSPTVQKSAETVSASAMLTNVANEWLINFEDRPGTANVYELSAVIGCGCAVLDFDRNGLLDVLFVAEDSATNVALYSQETRGQFVECAAAKGLADAAAAGIAVADCNNDGWPDLFLTSRRANALYVNDSGQGFKDMTAASGLKQSGWGTSACWLDYDRDGWLDVFVTQYVDYRHRECTRLGGGDADFCTPSLFPPTADKLYRNTSSASADGRPTFEDVSVSAGITEKLTAGLGVTALDWNHDHWIDIYVASDQHPNLLWINQHGTFVEEAAIRGCDVDFQGRSQGSMGLALGHFNGDGIEDLVVSNLDGESHAVYCRDDLGFCTDRCRETGILTATRPLTGFGISAADFDLDGVCDLLTVNGRVKRLDVRAEIDDGFWKPYQQEIQLLKSDRQGGKWQIQTVLKGSHHVGRGLAIGDLDRDGDPDAVISMTGEPAMVLRNDYASVQAACTLRFVDPDLGGRSCPGASFSVDNGEDRSVIHTFQPCQSYMSTHAEEFYLAMPSETPLLRFVVSWPHGDLRKEEFHLTPGSSGPTVIERGRGKLLD